MCGPLGGASLLGFGLGSFFRQAKQDLDQPPPIQSPKRAPKIETAEVKIGAETRESTKRAAQGRNRFKIKKDPAISAGDGGTGSTATGTLNGLKLPIGGSV